MSSEPDDEAAAIARLRGMLAEPSPPKKTLEEIVRIEHPGLMCAAYCEYAQQRLYEPDKHQITRFEVVANLVSRFAYYFVEGGMMQILAHYPELPALIVALDEIGAGRFAAVMRRLHGLVQNVPADKLEACATMGELLDAVGESAVESLRRDISEGDAYGPLEKYLDANRQRLLSSGN